MLASKCIVLFFNNVLEEEYFTNHKPAPNSPVPNSGILCLQSSHGGIYKIKDIFNVAGAKKLGQCTVSAYYLLLTTMSVPRSPDHARGTA